MTERNPRRVDVASFAVWEFRAFGISDGIDAVFRIAKRTAYSLRGFTR